MFDPCPVPRLFYLPPGVDFSAELVGGLRQRATDPAALARCRLIVNTARMKRRVEELFQSQPTLLPRVETLADIGRLAVMPGRPRPVSALRRRLELAHLVSRLLDARPDLAPRAAIFDLADSLARLLEEMQGEGVDASRLSSLETGDLAEYWQNSRAFLDIVTRHFGAGSEAAPDAQAWQRLAVLDLIDNWRARPPSGPVIMAGSTGSRGTTRALMEAVSRLPHGAVILPGVDFDLPAPVFAGLGREATAQDHPQYRFARLLADLNLDRQQVLPWTDAGAPSPARNRLVSLALRPAPVTDQWVTEGPGLAPFDAAAQGMTLIEAAEPRSEALAIAVALREVVDRGKTAALITTDRSLTRRVQAALDRWGILADDSAGLPLLHSAPGRFLRQVAALFGRPLSGEALLSLLKHPLAHSQGEDRGAHLLMTRELELRLRLEGLPFPDRAWLDRIADLPAMPEGWKGWLGWIGLVFPGHADARPELLETHVARHVALAEAIARGRAPEGSGELWMQEAGAAAWQQVQDLRADAAYGGLFSPHEYQVLFDRVLEAGEVRNPALSDPRIRILGTLEARVQSADVVLLAGLNEGSWPGALPQDPWLNRRMRLELGLLLPEREIGLAALDFQQAVAAPEVVLSRSLRDDEAETVPSRWLNRFRNLLTGLPGGEAALKDMGARGARLIALAAELDRPDAPVPAADRPAPRPPAEARPRRLSATEITTLVRDPYAVYARHVLRLKPLDPLIPEPDPRVRGEVLHKVLENFVRATLDDESALSAGRLSAIARDIITDAVPWPAERLMWIARIDRIAATFVAAEIRRRQTARPALLEVRGGMQLGNLGFELTAKADRIDVTDDGLAVIYDYKSGEPPKPKDVREFDKQLFLEALIVAAGGFGGLPTETVGGAAYLGLGRAAEIAEHTMNDEILAEVEQGLTRLVSAYLSPEQGFLSRRMPDSQRQGDYDRLARHGEWTDSDAGVPGDLT